MPLSINITGCNSGQPYIINILAISIGPIVEIGNGIKDIDFGPVSVLKDYKKTVTITNKSKIEADFHTFTKNKISIFKPIPKHGILQPNDKMDIEIVCCADDAIKG